MAMVYGFGSSFFILGFYVKFDFLGRGEWKYAS